MSDHTTHRSATAGAIKQTRPFSSIEHEAAVALQRLASRHASEVAELLRPSGISAAQYNVLRILRGAGDAGRSCGEIGERLITKDPDITRLIDRLTRQGLAERGRGEVDRRVVMTRITAQGLELLASLDEPVAELHRRQFRALDQDGLRQLIALIDAVVGDAPAAGGNDSP